MIKWPSRLNLAQLPTPITKLQNFSQQFDGVNIWIKRDELTGMEVSGNKIRKLEFSIAEALDQSCDTIITCGGVQSNHCRATAVLCVRLGLKVHLILRGEQPQTPEGKRRKNPHFLYLDRCFSAEGHRPSTGVPSGSRGHAARSSRR
ncbi:MAG: pyridoxal-phosphate dependent enzyme [Proteobacteria bacterium]|nr:pyridoxal-phosphate dependent enzyme [Pseudomonadota bacterium]